MPDLTKSFSDAGNKWASVMSDVLPKIGPLPQPPAPPEPSLEQLWGGMTARHIAGLAEKVGVDAAARFVRLMSRR